MASNQRNRGFTLVEVLVALVLLSIGLLGLAKLQFWGVKHTGSAYFRTQATQLANEMVERMRANPQAVQTSAYSLNGQACAAVACGKHPAKDCGVVACSPTEMAEYDRYVVACGAEGAGDHEGIDDLLPQGGIQVDCSKSGTKTSCKVEVCWQESGGNGKGAEDADIKGFVRMEVVP